MGDGTSTATMTVEASSGSNKAVAMKAARTSITVAMPKQIRARSSGRLVPGIDVE